MTILITGANRGIGLGLTKMFLSMDHRVIATAQKPETAADLHRLADNYPDGLRITQLDVTDPESIGELVNRLTGLGVRIEILINNAGIYPDKRGAGFRETCLDGMDAVFATNVIGVARVTQALLPLIPEGANAKIVNISSGAGLIAPKTDFAHYCYGPSKAALNMFTRTLAAELGPTGISVTAVSPGWVRTDMGGPDASLSVQESTGRLAKTILSISSKHNGCYLDVDGRENDNVW